MMQFHEYSGRFIAVYGPTDDESIPFYSRASTSTSLLVLINTDTDTDTDLGPDPEVSNLVRVPQSGTS